MCIYCKDPQVPQPQIKLKHDETIINPFYMRQLLQYAYRTSREGRELSEEEQMEEAEVSQQSLCGTNLTSVILAACTRA